MYDWLYEKFKGYGAINNEIRKIRESSSTSKKRTWKFLWNAINSYFEHSYEDANPASLEEGMGNKVPGMVGKAKKEKKPNKWEKQSSR